MELTLLSSLPFLLELIETTQMAPTLTSEQKYFRSMLPLVHRRLFGEPERPDSSRRDELSIMLSSNSRFRGLALPEGSDSLCSVIVKDKC